MKFEVVQINGDYYVVEKSDSGIYRQYADCGEMRAKAERIANSLNKEE